MKIISNGSDETRDAAYRLGCRLKAGDVVALDGGLGAGKTVFAQGIAKALEIAGPVTSPTFVIVSEYHGTMPLYHMDLYRLNNEEEFYMLGADEMMEGNGITVIEWGGKAALQLPERTIWVSIEIMEDGRRVLEHCP